MPFVLVSGRPGEEAGASVVVDPPVMAAVGDGVGASDEPVEAVGTGATEAAAAMFVIVAEQITRAPPPLVESLPWLMVTAWASAWVPLA